MSAITLDFLHGRPACGKDTQANLLLLDIAHSSKVSGVYRSAFTQTGSYTKYHDLVKPYIKPLGQGIDIPGKVVADILADIIKNAREQGITTLLICGLLRTPDHKKAIDELLKGDHELTSTHIYLATGEGKALDQTHHRLADNQEAGGERLDDNDELMQARLARYKANTVPMLKELENEGRLHIIRADRNIDEIHTELKSLLVSETHILESPQTALSTMRR